MNEKYDHPPRVYRYFRSKQEAVDLTHGILRLTTHASLRDWMHPSADAGEGITSTCPPDLTADATPERYEQIARLHKLAGAFDLTGTQGVQIIGSPTIIHDVSTWMYCTSTELGLSRLGNYCVEIQNPIRFGHFIARAIGGISPGELSMYCGPAEYGPRDVTGDTPIPNPLFRATYDDEKEYRFIFFHPDRLAPDIYSPVKVWSADIAMSCRLI